MKPTRCKCCGKRRCIKNNTQNKDSDFVLTQYSVLSSEFLHSLHGAQTVITINLAVSIGILAILGTVIVGMQDNNMLLLLSVCDVGTFVGFLAAIFCIQTVNVSYKAVDYFGNRLEQIDREYCGYPIEHVFYHKPLRITISAFWMFALLFDILLSISLLYTINTYFNFVIIPVGFISVGVTALVLFLFMSGIIVVLNNTYKYWNFKDKSDVNKI